MNGCGRAIKPMLLSQCYPYVGPTDLSLTKMALPAEFSFRVAHNYTLSVSAKVGAGTTLGKVTVLNNRKC